MNPEYLKRMSTKELNEYAENMGFSVAKFRSADAKIKEIERHRNRSVIINTIGVEIEIPIKKVKDKRFSDLLSSNTRTDEDIEAAVKLIIGEEQYAELVKAATEEDGLVDTNALGYAIAKIVSAPELKNF